MAQGPCDGDGTDSEVLVSIVAERKVSDSETRKPDDGVVDPQPSVAIYTRLKLMPGMVTAVGVKRWIAVFLCVVLVISSTNGQDALNSLLDLLLI